MKVKSGFEEVMENRSRGLPEDQEITITGQDPVYSTPFRIGETCASVIAGVGVAISDIWELQTGDRQKSAIDVRHAAAALRSTHYMQKPDDDGIFRDIKNEEHQAMRRLTQPWPTRDGRWFLPHFGLPNLRKRVLEVLDCEPNPDSVRAAVSNWQALELEAAIDEVRACGAMVRSNEEWLDGSHGQILDAKPIVEIDRIGDSDPEPFVRGERPLSNIRVLDLTRILAGPIAARTLAEHGADVLMVTADYLPQIREHVMDTSHGKRSCFLDLKTSGGCENLKRLVQNADVFSQGYRPGSLDSLGFGPEDLTHVRPGIIYLSISCFGEDGPFSHRAGWEQVAQTVTGICHENGVDRPQLLPAAACDYTTGYLGAYGVLLALARRATEGGSYHVRVSLCQSGMFIYRHGKTNFDESEVGLSELELNALREQSATTYGELRYLGPVLQMSETQPLWSRPTPNLGGDPPIWLD